MNRLLVTGGCGFIGSALVRALHQAGMDVFVLDSDRFGLRHFLSFVDDSHFFPCDILERDHVMSCFRAAKPDVVVHLAAIHFIPYCNQFPFESANINLAGTANVLDAAAGVGSVEKLLFASTAAVYPVVDAAIPEDLAPGPLDMYGLSKFIGERLCHEFHLATGVPTIVCRFFNAFGPNETNPHLIPEIHRQLDAGVRTIRLGNLEPKRDFIHTEDLAAAIFSLLGRFDQGYDVFNLGSGEEYSVREIVDTFSRILDEPIAVEVDASRVRPVERMHLLADVTKLRHFAGWKPTISLEEGLRSLLAESGTWK